ncbi:hypothetical protein CYANOKiyG1_31950 [Okeania sp. KiyG1]|nr:choice-of-anchor L domain-containing protein [Okeania sp. KiyG1]GGA17658.1 hypothetical protein CYANOKiyG1_31950 [Okeania sp. KiyG1]
MTISKLIKKFATTLAGTAFVTLSGTTVAQAISITPTSNGNDLLNEVLGSGITIVPDSINYIGASGASGTFTDGLSSGIGIDSGIVITTGQAIDAKGPNESDRKTTDNKLPGDSDLDGLIPEEQTTFDATILEFDFESEGGDVFFDYVFASEEYVEWTNSKFNDVFGFFLNGTNIALIPGTSTPVAINTVNGGKPLGTDASNPQFFNNNDPSEGGPFFDLEYDGFTNVFTAQALGLSAGTHKIRLAIADAGDAFYDSAVFIKANSFSDMLEDSETTSEPTPGPEPRSQPTSEATPEPEATSEPTSEPTSGPEPTSEPTSEPEAISELTSEPTPEPEATSEPTSEPTSGPEPTSEPTSEPEAISELTSEPTSGPEPTSEPTSEPEAISELTSEPTSGPEPTSEPTSEPEAISELTSEPTPEPEAISELTSEPEAISELTSEPTPEPEAISELTSEPEAISELTSEPTPEPDTSIKDVQDIPEPSLVISLLGVGFAGLCSRKNK